VASSAATASAAGVIAARRDRPARPLRGARQLRHAARAGRDPSPKRGEPGPTRFVGLANQPTSGEGAQLIALGATACLGKRVEGRDVLNTIHLDSRGLHVLPHSTPATTAGPPAARRPDPARGQRPRPSAARPLECRDRDGALGQLETVRTHARSVFRKLGVKDRRELATLSTHARSARAPRRCARRRLATSIDRQRQRRDHHAA
jgi:DNA-binding NarL/FixJ family response regulator